MVDPASLSIVLLALLIAGAVKGIVGFGIQVVALSILTLALDLLSAMAIMLAPTIASNVWQALHGAATRILLRRLWPFLLAVVGAVFAGAIALSRVEISWLVALLGLVLVAYATLGLSGLRLQVAPATEPWLGPLAGGANGLIMGMTGSSVVPGTLYLQALGLPRDQLVQAMGMLYLAAALALAAAMQVYSLLSLELGIYSLSAVLPALAGMFVGSRLRRRIAERGFRRLFLCALLALGLYLLQKALLG